MRALIQRVKQARVEIGGKVVAAIGPGMLVLAGFIEDDGEADLAWLSAKLCKLRIFDDADGVMNRSVVDCRGDVLAVSQFTLFASLRKGSRPSWSRAACPQIAQPLFVRFVAQLERDLGRPVPTGVFGADMQVHLVNDGPVTIAIDTRDPQ